MKIIKHLFCGLFLLSAMAANAKPPGGSAQNGSKAVKHSGKALSHAAASTGKAASAVVAVPLIVIGNAGPVSAEIGQALWDHANNSAPLTITEKTITADPPPNKAMKSELTNYEEITKSEQELVTKKSKTIIKTKKTIKQHDDAPRDCKC